MTDEIIELYGMLEGDECYAKKKKKGIVEMRVFGVCRGTVCHFE